MVSTAIAFLGRSAAAAVMVATLAAPPASASSRGMQRISYEAIPRDLAGVSLAASTYEQRELVTEAALESIAPRVLKAIGVDPARIDTLITPGGRRLETNPALQATGALSDEEATRVAAAFGYVFRQRRVLVSQPHDPEGQVGIVVVGFPEGALTPALAQSFFEFAALSYKGFAAGYTALGDEMVFLNMRDARGEPYSMLDDMTYAAMLGRAAGAFGEAQAKIADAGFAEARVVLNDWDAAPMGEDFMTIMADPAVFEDLKPLRLEHETMVRRMAAEYGWN